jgi:hypothetical protein
MRQMTLASQASFEKYARKSRREEFLSVMAWWFRGVIWKH